MHRARLLLAARVFGVLLLMALYGCSGGSGGDDNGGGNVSQGGGGSQDDSGQQTANPAFNGTFGGVLTVVQDGQLFEQAIAITMTVGSPLNGTFVVDTGSDESLWGVADGSLWGEADGNSATFTADFSTSDFGIGNTTCGGVVSGSMLLIDANSIAWEADGFNCNGDLTSASTLTRMGAHTASGEWQGRWASDGLVGTIRATLSDDLGAEVSGTVALTESPCFTTGAISGDIISTVDNNLIAILSAGFGGNQGARLDGKVLPGGIIAMTGSFTVSNGLCDGDIGGWTLIKISD
jgi:hypothetical protein